MPLKSHRNKAIDSLIETIKKLQVKATLREIMDEEDSIEDYLLIQKKSIVKKIIARRYLFRLSKNRARKIKFDLDGVLSYDSKNTNDEEFLQQYRITRDSFFCCLMS